MDPFLSHVDNSFEVSEVSVLKPCKDLHVIVNTAFKNQNNNRTH